MRTGRASSRETARLTAESVSSSASALTVLVGEASTSGSRGKSSAPYVFSRYSAGPQLTRRVFSSSRNSIVTSLSGSSRDRSTSSRPGTTTAPSPSTWASSVVRIESSMSVAASSSFPPAARKSTPLRIWTAVRVETPRADDGELLRELLARDDDLETLSRSRFLY